MSEMKERPILFNTEMIRALLDGRKTQTRRVVKHIPMLGGPLAWCAAAAAQEPGWVNIVGDYRRFCPYGQPGDRLWVRETFKAFPDGDLFYRADFGDVIPVHADDNSEDWTWKPSIFMPRAASRLTLEIVSVRVERVQSISHRDALAEGVSYDVSKPDGAPVPTYQKLWDSINAKRGYGWDKNPWVWVVEFKRI
jgi:hypothetical protein